MLENWSDLLQAPQPTGQTGKGASSTSKTSPFIAAMQTSISRPIGLASSTAPAGGQQHQPKYGTSLYQEKSPLSVKRSELQAA
uniref:Uncharacterized protein n=1 Tax=Romanomermis culicivorax TaxID=13658 RepID=A0A915HJU2_ROMCU